MSDSIEWFIECEPGKKVHKIRLTSYGTVVLKHHDKESRLAWEAKVAMCALANMGFGGNPFMPYEPRCFLIERALNRLIGMPILELLQDRYGYPKPYSEYQGSRKEWKADLQRRLESHISIVVDSLLLNCMPKVKRISTDPDDFKIMLLNKVKAVRKEKNVDNAVV